MKLAIAFALVAVLAFMAGWLGMPRDGVPTTIVAAGGEASLPAAGSASVAPAPNATATSPSAGPPAKQPSGETIARSTGAALSTTRPATASRSVQSLSPAECATELESARATIADFERKRGELEGDPIAPRAPGAPRFGESGLVQTFNQAFAASKIEGRVESVDCTEYPCVVFGRLNGDEEMIAKLENTAPFQQYDADVGVMLTWAQGDHEHGAAAQLGERAKPAEISLFAFAFYTDEDKAQHGDHINRRIRVRTAEYWNASSHEE
jgi:hypothetical protein